MLSELELKILQLVTKQKYPILLENGFLRR